MSPGSFLKALAVLCSEKFGTEFKNGLDDLCTFSTTK